MIVGLGITTYNRPDYFKRCIKSVEKHLLDAVDVIWVYNDGSDVEYDVIIPEGMNYHYQSQNRGVAVAKNWLLKKLMSEGCDYMFLLEDDLIIKSPKAVTEYIKLSDESGIEHFMFAHHGQANKDKLMLRRKGVDIYRNAIGAWCMYTRKVIEEVGYFDENFKNAWEHVEHSWRIAKAGYTPPWGANVCDVTKSPEYLGEIPGSIENSSIKSKKDWRTNNINGLTYWQNKDSDFPLKHILEELLKEESQENIKLKK